MRKILSVLCLFIFSSMCFAQNKKPNESANIKSTKTLDAGGVIERIAFSPDGQILVSLSSNPQLGKAEGSLKVWQVKDGSLIRSTKLETNNGNLEHVGLSPDLHVAAIIKGEGVELRRISDNSHIRTIEGNWNWGVVFSPDSSLIAVGSSLSTYSSSVSILRVSDGKELYRIEKDEVLSRFSLSPDGRFLAQLGDDCPVSLWDMMSGREIKRRNISRCQLVGFKFSPNGKVLASFGTADSAVTFWGIDMAVYLRKTQLQPTPRLKTHPFGLIRNIAFSPNGRYLLWGEMSLRR